MGITADLKPKYYIVFIFVSAIIALLFRVPWWIIIPIIATAAVAFMVLLDALLFVGKVYKSAAEPTVISGMMQAIPLLAIPFVHLDFSSALAVAMAFSSGIIYMYAFSLYFQSMRYDQDGVVIAVMWNLMIALVPLLAFLFVGERLTGTQYLGITLVFFGALIATVQKARSRSIVVVRMFIAVLLLSMSAVLMKGVFELLTASGSTAVYWSGILPHAAGSAFVGLFFFRKVVSPTDDRAHFWTLIARFWPLFFFMEGVQVAADTLSNLSIFVGDVSVVTAIDGLLGIFMAALSILLFFGLSRTRFSAAARDICEEQFSGFSLKALGMTIIVIGAYLVA